MAKKNNGDWRDLFDVALFEPNRAKLRRCIEHAKHAINHQLEALTHDPDGGGTTAERIALSDALTTLAELHKIVFARKPGAKARRQEDRTVSEAGLQ
jgi:hypothetical protein